MVASGVALSLTLVRCSPLSLSQSKLRYEHAGAPSTNTGLTNPTAATPIGSGPGSSLNPGQQNSALTNVEASVSNFPDYQLAINALPSEQRLSITAESNPEAFDAFKSSGTISLHFAGQMPDECKIYLGLASNVDWNDSNHPITTDCTPQPNGNWKVSISTDATTQDTWSQLSPGIQGLTVFVANRPQMTVVTATPQVRVTPQH